jgi:hypothetical protein
MVGIQLVESKNHWRARVKSLMESGLHTIRGFPGQATQLSSSQEELGLLHNLSYRYIEIYRTLG